MSTSTLGLLPWSLVGAPGVGPSRERVLWGLGAFDRSRLPAALESLAIRGARADQVVAFAASYDAAVARRDVPAIHAMLPTRERWRILPLVLEDAVAVDVEMDGTELLDCITAISLRSRTRAACWLRGMRNPPALDLLAQAPALLSFNGAAFDVPVIQKAWPAARFPAIHVDLVALARRLKVFGGLKIMEAQAGWERAPHVTGLRGGDAIVLWQRWLSTQDRAALQTMCEYNMEDVWSLPYLAAWAHDALVRRLWAPALAVGAPDIQPLRGTWQERAEAGPMMLGAVQEALKQV